MKAVICPKYGPPEVLQIKEIDTPVPKSNQVLVKVLATPINSGDVRVRGLVVKGFMKFVIRLVLGFNKPRRPVLGTVFSGIIEQTGKNVQNYKIGDEVFGTTGFKMGAHAEYVTIDENSSIAKKPANSTFEEAAAIPFGGQTAIYFLDKAKVSQRSDPAVLIYGATGSVGMAAIQIAKYHNAEVTAVCSTRGKSLVEEIGVQHIILYDREDFTKTPQRFDIIFDAVGKTSKKQCKPLLKPNGQFVTVGGMDVASERKEYLQLLCKLFEQGQYRATIDKIYPFNDVVEAHNYVDTGRKKGNVVLKLNTDRNS